MILHGWWHGYKPPVCNEQHCNRRTRIQDFGDGDYFSNIFKKDILI